MFRSNWRSSSVQLFLQFGAYKVTAAAAAGILGFYRAASEHLFGFPVTSYIKLLSIVHILFYSTL
jgi:hypothetical protein